MINLSDYGYIETALNNLEGAIPARVLATHRDRYEVISQFGTCFAKLKTSIYYGSYKEAFPTTGDFVLIKYQENGESLILKTLERKSCFSRRDPTPGRGEQIVASNFDYVFIMASLNHDYNINRIERYLTLAWQSGGVPVIVLTKSDLVEDFSDQVRAIENIAIGVGVYAVSAKTGFGLKELSAYLKPKKTIVFLGSSGVGKSSLVNALAGEDIMSVNTIREDDSKGKHTTTHRQLIMLKNGTMIIDTPGMRELGMWDVSEGLGQSFSDVEEYIGKCKFNDCKHQTEPGCAIKDAIAKGLLSEKRWENYNNLKNEAKFSDDKESYLRNKEEWCKSIAKWNKQNGKVKY